MPQRKTAAAAHPAAGSSFGGSQIQSMSTILRLSLLGTLHLCTIQSFNIKILKGQSIFNTQTEKDFVSVLGSQRRYLTRVSNCIMLQGVGQVNSDKEQRATTTTSWLDETKVYETTVAIIPPDEAWGTIQALRLQLRDSGLYRWPPHINLLYPFVPVKHFPEACSRLAESLQHIEPFELTLAELRLLKRK